MEDLEDAKLKDEIAEIMENVDNILKNIEAHDPSGKRKIDKIPAPGTDRNN